LASKREAPTVESHVGFGDFLLYKPSIEVQWKKGQVGGCDAQHRAPAPMVAKFDPAASTGRQALRVAGKMKSPLIPRGLK
jgi:hypothetical protein